MTTEKVIEIIDVAISEVEWNLPLDFAVAFNVAKEALESKKEMRPENFKTSLDKTSTIWNCPKCGSLHASRKVEQYCCDCGQKIMWR